MAVHAGPDIVTDGLVLHLDAANGRSYPGSGSTWFDLSGRGNDVTLYNSPTFSNGTINFPGTNQYGRTTSTLDLSSTAAITIISAWRTATTSTNCMVYEYSANWNGSINGFGLYSNSDGGPTVENTQHIQLRGNTDYAGTNASSPPSSSFGIYSVRHNFSSSAPETTVYINSSSPTVNNYGGNNTNTSFGNEYLYIGSRGGTSVFGNTTIAFLMIYTRSISDFEILQNFNSLRGRFGL
jgi:hypothetical protein